MQDLHSEWKDYYKDLEDIRFFGHKEMKDTAPILAKRCSLSYEQAEEIATY